MNDTKKLCNRWFEHSRRHNRHPLNDGIIDPDNQEWENIEELCSDYVRNTFPLIAHKTDPGILHLPDWATLEVRVKDIVTTYWDTEEFPSLGRRASYQSSDDVLDLFDGSNIRTLPGIICPHNVPDVWKDLKNHDDKKDIMKYTTKFITDHMFGSVMSRLRFLKLITTIFKTVFNVLYSTYNDERFHVDRTFLVLKGGMSFRMNVMEMIRELSSSMEGYLTDLLRTELRLGDFDFEVISGTSDLTTDEIVRLNVIIYMVIMLVRNYIHDHSDYFMEFFRFSKKYQQDLINTLQVDIQEGCRKLPVDHFFYGITIDHIQVHPIQDADFDTSLYISRKSKQEQDGKRTDFSMVVDGRVDLPQEERDGICFIGTKQLLKMYGVRNQTIQLLTKQSPFFTSHNPIISFTDNTNQSTIPSPTVSFQLNRIKYSFTIYFQRRNHDGSIAFLQDNFPGEILDVSHSFPGDTKRSQPTNLRDLYQVSSIRNINEFDFTTMTPYGQLKDHRFMLFTQVSVPWMVPKYRIRITRYVCIFILYIFSENGPTCSFRNKITLLRRLLSDIKKGSPRSNIGPSVIKEFRYDVLQITGDSQRITDFRMTIMHLLEMFITVFSHEYRRSRNIKLINRVQDPLVLSSIYKP